MTELPLSVSEQMQTTTMREFRPYLDYLDSLISQIGRDPDYSSYAEIIDDTLDSQPARELRRLVPLEDLKTSGAFFSGSELSQAALSSSLGTLGNHSVVLDPTCGTGDLLIVCAPRLPRGSDLTSTLQMRGAQITGCDVHSEFIYAAKARLVLAAIREGIPLGKNPLPEIDDLFPKITKGSTLTRTDMYESATHIVLNPPYTLVDAPEGCTWTSGKVNAAALFMETCVKHAQHGTRLIAILPDVLRSGARYQKWRELIESRSQERRIELRGQFSQWADVDVFILELEIQSEAEGGNENRWKQPAKSGAQCIGDQFSIHVGPVVDFRDPKHGPWYPFIISRDAQPWKTLNTISRHRRFKGTVFSPPFVVVRRTSRQDDEQRAVGTIVDCERPVAVENHLLVLVPKDDTMEACQQLLKVLEMPETTQWLNQRIRCRHLTVSSLKEIPWWIDGNE